MHKHNMLTVVSCIGAAVALASLTPAANGRRSGDGRRLLVVRPDTLVRDGAVLIPPDGIAGCVRSSLPLPGNGGVVLGLATCDPGSAGDGGVQLERVFEAPHQPTVLTVRITPPAGVARSIQSSRRDGRARIRFDGRVIWETRAATDDGAGHHVAIAQPEVLTTVVIHRRMQHTLRFEVERGVTWSIGGIEVRSDPAPRSIKGLAYSPYRDCQIPGGARQPTAAEIDDDIVRIIHSSSAIRTYSTIGVNAQVVAAAEAAGHPVYAGAWIDRVPGDQAELDALIRLARTGRPAGYIVGNEFYLRHRDEGQAAIDYLLAQLRRFRASLPVHHAPVMTADVDDVMFQWGCEDGGFRVTGIVPAYEPILEATDAVLVHIYPFWTRQPITGAAAMAAGRYVAIRDFVRRRYPGKQVILGETGWPSAGAPQGAAVPGRDAQRRYMGEFMQLADANAIDYFYFDAFDEGWKIEEPGHVGQHWGYADATRAAKYDISGALIPAALLAASVGPPAVVPAVCGETAGPTSGAPLADVRAQIAPRGEEPVYSDWLSDTSRFVPVGWMGDTDKIDVFACDRSAPHSGEMAIRAQFSPDGAKGWGGVAWRAPDGTAATAGGLDLRRFDRLSFWVRGDHGGEVVELQVGGAGASNDAHRDTLRPARSSGPLVLSGDWQPVSIALDGGDRSRVISGFSWVASRCQNSRPIMFFLDDIRFERAPPATRVSSPARAPFYIYDDHGSGCGHFTPSGFMGDIRNVKLNTRSTEAPFKGRTAIQVSYRASGRNDAWAGVYWQEPEHNWGTRDGGFDLSWATVLTFHARGRTGGEVVEFLAGGMGKPGDRYRDTMPTRTTGPVRITNRWHRYTIDLLGADRSRVVGGFAFSISAANNPEGAEFFLDEITYERR